MSGKGASGTSNPLQVFVRIRPLSAKEVSSINPKRQRTSIVQYEDSLVFILQPDIIKSPEFSSRREKSYAFDHVFPIEASNNEVYSQAIAPLVEGVLDGYNATGFAYGMTGAGKTHTMHGDLYGVSNGDKGVCILTMEDMFRRIIAMKERREFKIRLSYLEIYNEHVKDLLVEAHEEPSNLMIVEDPNRGVFVPNLSEHVISTVTDVMNLIIRGNENRTMAPTGANIFSSRSHAILMLNIEQRDKARDVVESVHASKFCLIDLAGSERGAASDNRGQRLVEGANINRSLLALGNCINILADSAKKGSYVPYRDSKLTRLLKDSLGGNTKTAMIACISPSALCYEESVNTLNYASRARSIKKKVERNIKQVQLHVSKYKEIIDSLKNEIEYLRCQLRSQDGGSSLESPQLGQVIPLNSRKTADPAASSDHQKKVLDFEKEKAQLQDEIAKDRELIESNDGQPENKSMDALSQKLMSNFEENCELRQGLSELEELKEQNQDQVKQLESEMKEVQENMNKGEDESESTQKVSRLQEDILDIKQSMENNEKIMQEMAEKLQKNMTEKEALQGNLVGMQDSKKNHVLEMQIQIRMLKVEKLELHTTNLVIQREAEIVARESQDKDLKIEQMEAELTELRQRLREKDDLMKRYETTGGGSKFPKKKVGGTKSPTFEVYESMSRALGGAGPMTKKTTRVLSPGRDSTSGESPPVRRSQNTSSVGNSVNFNPKEPRKSKDNGSSRGGRHSARSSMPHNKLLEGVSCPTSNTAITSTNTKGSGFSGVLDSLREIVTGKVKSKPSVSMGYAGRRKSTKVGGRNQEASSDKVKNRRDDGKKSSTETPSYVLSDDFGEGELDDDDEFGSIGEDNINDELSKVRIPASNSTSASNGMLMYEKSSLNLDTLPRGSPNRGDLDRGAITPTAKVSLAPSGNRTKASNPRSPRDTAAKRGGFKSVVAVGGDSTTNKKEKVPVIQTSLKSMMAQALATNLEKRKSHDELSEGGRHRITTVSSSTSLNKSPKKLVGTSAPISPRQDYQILGAGRNSSLVMPERITARYNEGDKSSSRSPRGDDEDEECVILDDELDDNNNSDEKAALSRARQGEVTGFDSSSSQNDSSNRSGGEEGTAVPHSNRHYFSDPTSEEDELVEVAVITTKSRTKGRRNSNVNRTNSTVAITSKVPETKISLDKIAKTNANVRSGTRKGTRQNSSAGTKGVASSGLGSKKGGATSRVGSRSGVSKLGNGSSKAKSKKKKDTVATNNSTPNVIGSGEGEYAAMLQKYQSRRKGAGNKESRRSLSTEATSIRNINLKSSAQYVNLKDAYDKSRQTQRGAGASTSSSRPRPVATRLKKGRSSGGISPEDIDIDSEIVLIDGKQVRTTSDGYSDLLTSNITNTYMAANAIIRSSAGEDVFGKHQELFSKFEEVQSQTIPGTEVTSGREGDEDLFDSQPVFNEKTSSAVRNLILKQRANLKDQLDKLHKQNVLRQFTSGFATVQTGGHSQLVTDVRSPRDEQDSRRNEAVDTAATTGEGNQGYFSPSEGKSDVEFSKDYVAMDDEESRVQPANDSITESPNKTIKETDALLGSYLSKIENGKETMRNDDSTHNKEICLDDDGDGDDDTALGGMTTEIVFTPVREGRSSSQTNNKENDSLSDNTKHIQSSVGGSIIVGAASIISPHDGDSKNISLSSRNSTVQSPTMFDSSPSEKLTSKEVLGVEDDCAMDIYDNSSDLDEMKGDIAKSVQIDSNEPTAGVLQNTIKVEEIDTQAQSIIGDFNHEDQDELNQSNELLDD